MSLRSALGLILLLFSQPVFGVEPGTVAFQGNQFIDSASLQFALEESDFNLLTAAAWDSEEQEQAAKTLQDLYQEKGFPLVRVEQANLGQRLLFTIREGPRTRVDRIQFEGNSAFPDTQLGEFFQRGRWYCRSRLRRSIGRLLALYLDHGYISVEVSEPVFRIVEENVRDHFPFPFRTEAACRLLVEITVTEGEQFRLGRVSISEELLKQGLAPPKSGEVFSRSAWIDFRRQVEELYKGRDQLLDRFEVRKQSAPHSNQLDITVIAEPYPPLIVRRIEFKGHQGFPDSFYRREIELAEGEIFSPRELEKGLRRLSRTGTLESLSPEDIELVVDRETQEIDVLINLNERESKRIAYSFDPNTIFGWESSLVFTIFNALGLGETLGLDVRYGDQTAGLALALSSKYLVGTDLPVSFLLGLFKRHTGFDVPGVDDEIRGLFGTSRQGFTTALTYRISEDKQGGLALTAEKIPSPTQSYNHFWVEPFFLSGGPENQRVLKASTRFSAFSGQHLSWNLKPEITFLRRFHGLDGGSKFSLRTQASHAFFFGLEPSLSDRLFTSQLHLRGFSPFTAGPWALREGKPFPGGGDTLASAGLEYQLRYNRRLTVVPFVDSAWLGSLSRLPRYSVIEETNGVLRSSVGAELRVQLPGSLPTTGIAFSWNPLRLDTMIPLGEETARLRDPRFRVTLTAGR